MSTPADGDRPRPAPAEQPGPWGGYAAPGSSSGPGGYGPPASPGPGYGGPGYGEVATGGYGPPPGTVRPVQRPGQLAGLGRRFVARLLDDVGLTVVGLVVAFAFSGTSLFTSTELTAGPAEWFGGVLVAVATYAYFVLLESRRGQTLGKMALGIRTVAPGGGTPSTQQALRRNGWHALQVTAALVAAVPVLGVVVSGVVSLVVFVLYVVIAATIAGDDEDRGLHDRFAGGTTVVRA